MRYKDIEFVGIVYNNYYFRVGILYPRHSKPSTGRGTVGKNNNSALTI